MQDKFFATVGYCTQFDFFPRGITGHGNFFWTSLMLYGMSKDTAVQLADEALQRVQHSTRVRRGARSMAISKGMRQKIRLAQAKAKKYAHRPQGAGSR